MKKNITIMKRTIPLWVLVLALVAVSAGAAAGTILAGKVVGEVPVAVSQALLVGEPFNSDNVTTNVTADTDMPQQINDNVGFIAIANRFIGVRADDNTAFQAAMELATGDWTTVALPIKNASENDLYALLTLDVPDGLEVEIWIDEDTAINLSDIVRIGPNTWKFRAEKAADFHSFPDYLMIVISVDDDAPPGYYTISGTIKQIPY